MNGLRKELLIAQAADPSKTVKALAAYLFPNEGCKAAYHKVSRLIRNSQKTVRVDLVPKICEFLNTDPNKLFEYGN